MAFLTTLILSSTLLTTTQAASPATPQTSGQAPPPKPASNGFPQAPWIDFVPISGGKAIFVPVKVEGFRGNCVMQLDTGSDATLLYCKPKKGEKETVKPGIYNLRMSVGGQDFGKRAISKSNVMSSGMDATGKYNIIGTIGLDCFTDHAWALDFVNHRFAVAPFFKGLPAEARKPGVDLGIIHRNQKMFIPVKISGVDSEDYFYDSGSATSGILTDEATWKALTGKQVDDPSNSVQKAFSWGKPIELITNQCAGGVSIGAYQLKNTTATFTKNPPENLLFSGYPFKAAGLIGNQAFEGRAIVVIEVRDTFMRIIETKNP